MFTTKFCPQPRPVLPGSFSEESGWGCASPVGSRFSPFHPLHRSLGAYIRRIPASSTRPRGHNPQRSGVSAARRHLSPSRMSAARCRVAATPASTDGARDSALPLVYRQRIRRLSRNDAVGARLSQPQPRSQADGSRVLSPRPPARLHSLFSGREHPTKLLAGPLFPAAAAATAALRLHPYGLVFLPASPLPVFPAVCLHSHCLTLCSAIAGLRH